MPPNRLPTYFLSHGGGPWPWLPEQAATYSQLEQSLLRVRREVGGVPRAVLMISGHWEADGFLLSSSARPPMVFDYRGFPEHTYRIRYDAPGEPALARTVEKLLEQGGLKSGLDPARGYDHGTFTIMQTIYPEADIPLIQLSIDQNYDPAEHLRAGELLAPLRDQGILIIGSGLSYHDLRSFRTGTGAQASSTFDHWLNDTLANTPPDERRDRLLHWSQAPAARAAHPQEDHLIPLMVAAGAARNEPATRIYHQPDFMGAITVSSYRFGTPIHHAHQLTSQSLAHS